MYLMTVIDPPDQAPENFRVELLAFNSAVFVSGETKWIVYLFTKQGILSVTWEKGVDFTGDDPVETMMERSVEWASRALDNPIYTVPPTGAVN